MRKRYGFIEYYAFHMHLFFNVYILVCELCEFFFSHALITIVFEKRFLADVN